MDHLRPGPIDPSLLRLQENHISTKIWNGVDRQLRARHKYVWKDVIDEGVQESINTAGFGLASCIRSVPVNHHLITALVERWRPETHTFHFPHGEAIVTLEDVALHLGLPIDGHAVTGATQFHWPQICQELLGAVPPENCVKGQSVNIT